MLFRSLVEGNRVRLLCDARENYPAWLAAIGGARRVVLFENYIIQNDAAGRRFADALIERAQAGVAVCVVYDWFGGLGLGSKKLLQPLIDAGGEVRVFNRPSIASPLGWMQRDHRKMLAVDGRIGYVSGLCVGARWEGDDARGIAPWRDTGVEIAGPAVADLERAFAQVWRACGAPLPDTLRTPAADIARAGGVTLRVLASQPYTAGLYRLDQLVASMATRTLWLTDAYYVGLAPYVRALRAAATDGVDVRLLVPGASNLAAVSTLSRVGYRTLLEAGVRVFEWNGPMLHAKTAVADGLWARVGSTNLNASSWLANHELDIAVEDAGFAGELAAVYERDLANATEIVLSPRRRVLPAVPRERVRGQLRGSASRAAAGALLIGNTVQAAIANQRLLGPAEAGIMGAMGLALIALVAVGLLWPYMLMLPLCAFGAWVGVSLLIRAYRLRRQRGAESNPPPPPT